MAMYYNGSIERLDDMGKREVAAYLRANADGVTLGTMGPGGVRLTMMGLLQGAEADGFFMQTDRASRKVENIAANAACEVAVSDGRGFVVLSCTVEVVDDEALKQEKWEEWMAQYHPEGPTAPGYVLLRFAVREVRAMI